MTMRVSVHFYSYFKDLTGTLQTEEELPAAATISQLLQKLFVKFPRLETMQRSMLTAVGVDYQPQDYVLQDGDEVSLFPPVQGG